MTSLLKRATFIVKKDKEEMFNNANIIMSEPELKKEFENGFLKDCALYRNAKVFVACGSKVFDVLLKLKEEGIIKVPVLGIAHPSALNNDRIRYYLGEETDSFRWCREQSRISRELIESLIE